MSSIHNVEIVIHVDDALAGNQRDELISNLQRYDGIEKASFTAGRNHLMLIGYDTNKLNTMDVPGYVKQENYKAELIGI